MKRFLYRTAEKLGLIYEPPPKIDFLLAHGYGLAALEDAMGKFHISYRSMDTKSHMTVVELICLFDRDDLLRLLYDSGTITLGEIGDIYESPLEISATNPSPRCYAFLQTLVEQGRLLLPEESVEYCTQSFKELANAEQMETYRRCRQQLTPGDLPARAESLRSDDAEISSVSEHRPLLDAGLRIRPSF